MSKSWPKVRFGDVMRQRRPDISVDPTGSYQFAGVYCFGRGVFRGQERAGSEFAYATLSRVRAGEFIYPKLMAWEGAFGVVPASCDGFYVSPEFPVFEIDADRLDVRFLSAYFKIPRVWDAVSGGSTGTNVRRRRLNPSDFLQREMPLPSLAEQWRIVARIEELSAEIREAGNLRQQAAEETEALRLSASAVLFNPKPDWKIMEVGEFCDAPQYGYTESATDQVVGPRFLRITDIQNGSVDWTSVPYCRCPNPAKYLLKPNDLVFARTGATTGKSFVIRGCPEAVFASYLIRLRVRESVAVDYLFGYFQTASYWMQIAEGKEGTGQPNLNGSKLAKLKVPIAPLSEQRRIVAKLDALQAEVDALKRLQAETATELDAVLPALLNRAFHGEL